MDKMSNGKKRRKDKTSNGTKLRKDIRTKVKKNAEQDIMSNGKKR